MSKPVENIAFAAFLLILALSPIPLASNRPIFWAIWASLIFITSGFILISQAINPRKPAAPVRNFRWLIILASILAAYMIFQSTFGQTPRSSTLATVRAGSYMAFFWLAIQFINTPARQKMVLHWLLFMIAINAMIALALLNGWFDLPDIFGKTFYPNSATGTFVNRNSFATYLGFGVLTGAALTQKQYTKLKPRSGGVSKFFDPCLTIYLSSAVLILITLILTNSRMGQISTFTGLIALLWLKSPSGFYKRTPVFLTALSCTALFILLYFTYGYDTLLRTETLRHDINVRLNLYAQVWHMIQQKPLTGFGADSFVTAFPQFQHPPLDPSVVWDKAHNTYLTNWAEMGLLFGSIPLILGIVIAAKLLRTFHNNTYAGLAFATLILAAVHSTADFSLEIQANMFVFLTMLAVGISNIRESE